MLLSDCLLVSSTQVKSWEVAAQGIFSSHLRPHGSILGALFCSLNDGVPVEVVLDVVGRQHAPHLEVSQRQPVLLLLLAQLAEVAYGWRRSTLLSVFRTWPHSHLNSHSCPDVTNLTFLMKVWTDKNYFYYTFRTRLLSDVFLNVFLDAISCVWAILSYFTRDCNALDVTNRWSRLIPQEMMKLSSPWKKKKWNLHIGHLVKILVGYVCATNKIDKRTPSRAASTFLPTSLF